MARKYKDYKNDPTIKVPIVAWFFNRGFFQLVYTAMAAFSVVAMIFLYTSGANAWKKITTEPQNFSPYQEVSSVNSPGRDWAEQMINKIPPELTGWTVSETTKPQNVKALNCAFNDNPSMGLLSTHIATSGNTETRVLLYGAGQASADFDKYTEIIDTCAGVEKIDEEFGRTALFNNGFIITMGDTIVNVITDNNSQRDSLYDFYYNEILNTLKASSCLALDVSANDSTRSFFYDSEKYQGLKETTVVEAQVDTNNIPTVSSLRIDEIAMSGINMPESPLPQDFPSLPTEKVTKPELPQEIENRDDFTSDAVYNIADMNGPGCGWAWSGQKPPIYNNTELEINKNSTIVTEQNRIDEEAQQYVDQKNNWAFNTALIMPSINEWNEYVYDVNTVHEKWNWLNLEREKLYDPWHEYVEEYNDWESFDQRKSDALSKYNEDLQKCMDKQEEYLAWDKEWGDLYAQQESEKNQPNPPVTPEEAPEPTEPSEPTENPTDSPTTTPEPTVEPSPPVDIPEPPENCSVLPPRPSIIDQEKPAEPQAPSIPAGVTIPDSWEKP